MSLRMLEFISAVPSLYYLGAITGIFGFMALGVLPEGRITQGALFEFVCLATAGFALLAWRWPTFLWEYPMNPDEGLWPAGALKSMVDFVPWRGFDGTTSGPLNAYVLMLPALVGARISFFSTRLIGACLTTATIAALYYAAKWVCGARVARLTIIPPVLLLSLTTNWNFLHFSSETLPIFLTTSALAAAAYLASDCSSGRGRLIACAVVGLCVGSTGFAKLQALPIGLAILGFGASQILFTQARSGRNASVEVLATAIALFALPVAIASALLLTGEWQDAIISYLKASAGYVARGASVGAGFFFWTSAEYTLFVLGSLVIVLAAVLITVCYRNPKGRAGWTAIASAVLLLTSLFAIYAPRHAFPHYLLLAIAPMGFVVANALSLLRNTSFWKKHEISMGIAYGMIFFVPALSVAMAAGPSSFVKELAFNSTWIGTEQARSISHYARPGSRIVIWGWAPWYYVQTGTVMATRDAQTGQQITPNPYYTYFRARFMSDLRSHPPAVFVDAVAPEPGGYRYTDRATQGLESFPELGAFVRDYYILKEEIGGVRIFVPKTR